MATLNVRNLARLILMILPGCASRPTRRVAMLLWLEVRCLRMNPGRQIGFRFSRSGWTRVALHKHEGYSFAIISRRSAMCCLILAIFSGQEPGPWYGTAT